MNERPDEKLDSLLRKARALVAEIPLNVPNTLGLRAAELGGEIDAALASAPPYTGRCKAIEAEIPGIGAMNWCDSCGLYFGKNQPCPSARSATATKLCPYCTSDNEGIRSTYYDQTCEGCVKRMRP